MQSKGIRNTGVDGQDALTVMVRLELRPEGRERVTQRLFLSWGKSSEGRGNIRAKALWQGCAWQGSQRAEVG